jgi:hypothetical protein
LVGGAIEKFFGKFYSKNSINLSICLKATIEYIFLELNMEINMEKKSALLFLISTMVIAVIVIPMSGVFAQNDNIKNIQYYCCSYIEEEKYNLHTVSNIITEPNLYL